MSCKYCAEYIRRALKTVENFERACVLLRLDPKKKQDEEAIVKALVGIGQFGAIRLARRYPWITDETEFHLVTIAGLHFYWLTLDAWEEFRAAEAAEREKKK